MSALLEYESKRHELLFEEGSFEIGGNAVVDHVVGWLHLARTGPNAARHAFGGDQVKF